MDILNVSELSFSEISKDMDRYNTNEKYFIDNYDTIKKEVGKFVAVDNDMIISDSQIENLLLKVDSNKIDRRTVFIQFIPEKIYEYAI